MTSSDCRDKTLSRLLCNMAFSQEWESKSSFTNVVSIPISISNCLKTDYFGRCRSHRFPERRYLFQTRPMLLRKFYVSYNTKAFTYLRILCAGAKMIFINPTCVSESFSTYRCCILNTLYSGFPSPRINLSPFTKDFRGGEELIESVDQFLVPLPWGGALRWSG